MNETYLTYLYKQAVGNGGEYTVLVSRDDQDDSSSSNSSNAYTLPSRPSLPGVPTWRRLLNSETVLRANVITTGGDSGGTVYMILINAEMVPLNATVQTLKTQFWVIAVILLCGAVTLAILISRNISVPIEKMNTAAKRLAKGDYNADFAVNGYREVMELSDSLTQAADALSQNDTLQKELIANISHDLRTPLCSVSGNADTLLHNGNCLDEATKQQIYKDIYDDSEWLIGVVENLLYVTRLNDGRLKLELTDQLVDEVVNEAVSHLKKKSVGHKVTVRCDDLILARMDAQLIVQVIVNLIDNALKYTEQGSEICVSAEKQGGDAVIRVADNGNGIADDMKPHIFEMFYTGKNTVADSRRSFGIGLTLCKSIVELHGGTLTLTDNVPHGCIFTFTLPLSEVTLNE